MNPYNFNYKNKILSKKYWWNSVIHKKEMHMYDAVYLM